MSDHSRKHNPGEKDFRLETKRAGYPQMPQIGQMNEGRTWIDTAERTPSERDSPPEAGRLSPMNSFSVSRH